MHVFEELPKIYKLVCANKPVRLQINDRPGRKISKPSVKCDECKYKSTLIQMKMHMKTVHGSRPTKASKRSPNFTPMVKTAKRSKPDNILNCDGVIDDSSILMMEDSFTGSTTTPNKHNFKVEKKSHIFSLEEDCPEPVAVVNVDNTEEVPSLTRYN